MANELTTATNEKPLPLILDTLDFIPANQQQCYKRDYTGKWELKYLLNDDAISRMEHMPVLAAGNLQILPPDMTVAELEAADHQQKTVNQAVKDAIAVAEKDEYAARVARMKARVDAEQRRLQAELDRYYESYGIRKPE